MVKKYSYETYSDTNVKVDTTSYGPSGNNNNGNQPKKLVVEKVVNLMSSIAGAGSGEFDLYRAARKRERDRLDELEKEEKKRIESEAIAKKMEINRMEAELRVKKNAEKRKRRKENQKKNKVMLKHNKKGSESEGSGEESEHSDEEATATTENNEDKD